MKTKINQTHIDLRLAQRQILGRRAPDFFGAAIDEISSLVPAGWNLELGSDLIYDSAGLRLILGAIPKVGGANEIHFQLRTDQTIFNNYYSLHQTISENLIELPVVAYRDSGGVKTTATIELPSVKKKVNFPLGLHEPEEAGTPLALIMRYNSEFDLLFANQIALVSDLARRVRKGPIACLRALALRHADGFSTRAALAYRKIHPSAKVHPTAVVEGSVIGEKARIGAHAVVRYSYIGANSILHDGAKAELSVIGDNSWLMHDLVLYRCNVEDEVFLIHGPYQFSSFHHRSAAFATIMMDYRPDKKPIRVQTIDGPRPYLGRFLGSVLQEDSKTLGGSLVAPGRIVPAGIWLSAGEENLHSVLPDNIPTLKALSPAAVKLCG